VELYTQSPNTSSWRGAQLKHKENFTFFVSITYFEEAHDPVGRQVLYNILVEFGTPTEVVRRIKMYLNENFHSNTFRIGKCLSDAFPIQNDLKQGDALSPWLLNFTLEYALRKVREIREGLELNGIRKLLAYANTVNISLLR
jgi:hypothetical protein